VADGVLQIGRPCANYVDAVQSILQAVAVGPELHREQRSRVTNATAKNIHIMLAPAAGKRTTTAALACSSDTCCVDLLAVVCVGSVVLSPGAKRRIVILWQQRQEIEV
jgi:hypothetical protein